MSEPEPPTSTGSDPNPDDELEPIQRDRGFIVRLVLALLVGLIAAGYLGGKIKNAAAGCGGGLIRPGSSVIPPPSSNTPR